MNRSLTIAAVYAHPDDGEFFTAGSLTKWAREGHEIHAICATNGDVGTKQVGCDAAALARTRAEELARAMEVIGGQPPTILGLPDAFVRENTTVLKERLVYFFRKWKVDRVVTFDPWKRYEIHPDHIAVGRMASEAACFSCFPLMYPEHIAEGLGAVQPHEVWYMMPTQHKPNRVVDIRDTFDTKVRSLFCHTSQMEMLADWFVPGADPTSLTPEQRALLEGGARTFLEGMARAQAMLAPPVELAEAFYAQRVGPGHFQNYQQMFMELAGAPVPPPEVC